MYITENGAAFGQGQPLEAQLHDERRVNFLREHLRAAHRAAEAGVPLHGFFAWSLMDNFEWAHGYEKRFGLFAVNYETQGAHSQRQCPLVP